MKSTGQLLWELLNLLILIKVNIEQIVTVLTITSFFRPGPQANNWDDQLNGMNNENSILKNKFAQFKEGILKQLKQYYATINLNLTRIFLINSRQDQQRNEIPPVPKPRQNLLQNMTTN